MDGQIWRLPAEVYSRLESVKLSDNLSFDEVIQILLDNEYRQTTMIAAPGVLNSKRIPSYYFVVRSLILTNQSHNVYYVYVLQIINFLVLKT